MSKVNKEEVKKKVMDESVFGPLVDDTFTNADTDKSGFIERGELKSVLNEISEALGIPSPTDAEIDVELKRLDTNNDGKVSKQEFRTLVKDLVMIIVEAI